MESNVRGFDIGIIKLSANGSNRLYATYLGGSGNETPLSTITDAAGNLIVASRTSSTNFPTTLSNYGPGGAYDVVITKFNASGTALIASIKMGGTNDDGVNIKRTYASPQAQ